MWLVGWYWVNSLWHILGEAPTDSLQFWRGAGSIVHMYKCIIVLSYNYIHCHQYVNTTYTYDMYTYRNEWNILTYQAELLELFRSDQFFLHWLWCPSQNRCAREHMQQRTAKNYSNNKKSSSQQPWEEGHVSSQEKYITKILWASDPTSVYTCIHFLFQKISVCTYQKLPPIGDGSLSGNQPAA